MIQIEYNKWYRFNSTQDKETFLYTAALANNFKYSAEEWNRYMNSECLKIVKDCTGNCSLRYRTTYDDRYMGDVEYFKADNTTNQENIKENKEMENRNSLIDLITVKQKSSIAIQKYHADEQRKDLLANCEAAKLLKPYIDYCIKQNFICDETTCMLTILDYTKLNDKERDKLRKINAECDLEIAEIENKYSELIRLVESTDTFEQAYTLLKAYNVLSKDVNL